MPLNEQTSYKTTNPPGEIAVYVNIPIDPTNATMHISFSAKGEAQTFESTYNATAIAQLSREIKDDFDLVWEFVKHSPQRVTVTKSRVIAEYRFGSGRSASMIEIHMTPRVFEWETDVGREIPEQHDATIDLSQVIAELCSHVQKLESRIGHLEHQFAKVIQPKLAKPTE